VWNDGAGLGAVPVPRWCTAPVTWARSCARSRTRLPSAGGFEARQGVLHPWPRASPARDGRAPPKGVHKLPAIERSSHGAPRAAVRFPCDAGIAATPGACRGYRTSRYRALLSTELARHELVPIEASAGPCPKSAIGRTPVASSADRGKDHGLAPRYTLKDQSRPSETIPLSPPGGATWRQSLQSPSL